MKDDGKRVVYEDKDYQARIDWQSMHDANAKRDAGRKLTNAKGTTPVREDKPV